MIVLGGFLRYFFDHTQPSDREILDTEVTDLRAFHRQPADHGSCYRDGSDGKSTKCQGPSGNRKRAGDEGHGLLAAVEPSPHERATPNGEGTLAHHRLIECIRTTALARALGNQTYLEVRKSTRVEQDELSAHA